MLGRPRSLCQPLTPSPCLGFTTLPDPDSCYVDTSVLVECSEAGAVLFSGRGLWEEHRRQPCLGSRGLWSSSWTLERTWNSQKPGHARPPGCSVQTGCGSKREGGQAPVGTLQRQRQNSTFSRSLTAYDTLYVALAYVSFLLSAMIHARKLSLWLCFQVGGGGQFFNLIMTKTALV